MTMQNDDKRMRILEAARELFTSLPFHKVLLSDVAKTAGVGKGTLYLYFKSKEQLYLAVSLTGYSAIVDRMRGHVDATMKSPEEQLIGIIKECFYALHGKQFVTELMRGTVVNCPDTAEWNQKRMEMYGLIETVLRRGVEQGVFEDVHPELTAVFVPGLIRSAILFAPDTLDVDIMCEHILNFVLKSLRKTH
ncbi:TetR/AcrR family transcriptional regulator [Desulfovibrio inopinatus]|uniref:TetR/AcrR family transcriptional regulator n=1 Tax=Desulfovibrio inopinatus TaxID=102109 RepID=UPI00054F2965|nr:TetR/AcrR family transcriptional regulator [Desulfovibrio inopinatus]